MDHILIKGLRIYAFHGVNPEEKEKGQPFELDITAHLDLAKPCQTDKVEDTVSYAQMVKVVKRAMLEQSYDLLERAAGAVAEALLEEYPMLRQVDILLKKPRAPILADFQYVAVEISRRKTDK